MPALAALLADAAGHALRDRRPLLRADLLDELDEQTVLLGRPRTLDSDISIVVDGGRAGPRLARRLRDALQCGARARRAGDGVVLVDGGGVLLGHESALRGWLCCQHQGRGLAARSSRLRSRPARLSAAAVLQPARQHMQVRHRTHVRVDARCGQEGMQKALGM